MKKNTENNTKFKWQGLTKKRKKDFEKIMER